MEKFAIELFTPEHMYYKGDVYQLTVWQSDGVRQILANHEPSIGTIVAGRCSFIDAKKIKRTFITGDGIISITRECTSVSSVTIQSERAFEKAQEDLENDSQRESIRRKKSREEYVRSKLEMAKSLSGKKDD